MRVTSITVNNHYNEPTGSIGLCDDNVGISLTLTADESREIMNVGLRIFEARQQALAKSIATMSVVALPPPPPPEYTEFVEVPAGYDPSDDIPF